MSWRDSLRRVRFGDGREMIGASFRQVPFFIESGEQSGGRRAVVHEFPGRDKPYVDDSLGARARTFRVEGYVLGDDFIAQRNALVAACEAKGPGVLLHPFYTDARTVVCLSYSVREAPLEGRIAQFSMEFAEAPLQKPAPSAVIDGPAQVGLSADAALAAAGADFEAGYDTDGAPSFSLETLESVFIVATNAIGEKLGPVMEATAEAARLTQQVEILTARAAALVRTPGEILLAFRETFAELADTIAAAPGALMQAFLDTYSVDFGQAPPLTTPTRQREFGNWNALTSALRRVMVTEAARLAPLVPFATHEEASAAAALISAKLEEQAATAGDELYAALEQLRTDLLRAVPGDQERARVLTVTRPVPIPSLLLAYQVHGHVDGEADIIARNGVRHPGVVSGTLQVLVDE